MTDMQTNITLFGENYENRDKLLEVFKSGPLIWNDYIRTTPHFVDFSGVDFSGYSDFTYREFPAGVSFKGCIFRDADFSNSRFMGRTADFSKTHFLHEQVSFIDCEFDVDDLSFVDCKINAPHICLEKKDFHFAPTSFSVGSFRCFGIEVDNRIVRFKVNTTRIIQGLFFRITVTDGKLIFTGEFFGLNNFNDMKLENAFLAFTTFKATAGLNLARLHGRNSEVYIDNAILNGDNHFVNMDLQNCHFYVEKCRFETANKTEFSNNNFNRSVLSFVNTNWICPEVNFNQNRHLGSWVFYDDNKFTGLTSFVGSDYKCPFTLSAEFDSTPPDLRFTKFDMHFSLSGLDVHHAKVLCSDDEDKYRRIKELAIIAKDHEQEQRYFAAEMKAKSINLKPRQRFLYQCYNFFSGYGRSISRPIYALLIVLVSWPVFYWSFIPRQILENHDRVVMSLKMLVLSISNMIPFLVNARVNINNAKGYLFNCTEQCSAWLDLLMSLQNFFAFIFLFLLGLGLRNRFRL